MVQTSPGLSERLENSYSTSSCLRGRKRENKGAHIALGCLIWYPALTVLHHLLWKKIQEKHSMTYPWEEISLWSQASSRCLVLAVPREFQNTLLCKCSSWLMNGVCLVPKISLELCSGARYQGASIEISKFAWKKKKMGLGTVCNRGSWIWKKYSHYLWALLVLEN